MNTFCIIFVLNAVEHFQEKKSFPFFCRTKPCYTRPNIREIRFISGTIFRKMTTVSSLELFLELIRLFVCGY